MGTRQYLEARRRYEAGEPVQAIARAVGVRYQTLYSYVREHPEAFAPRPQGQGPARKVGEEAAREARRMRRGGATVREVAGWLGVSVTTARRTTAGWEEDE